MHIGVLEDDTTQIELYKLWFSTAQHQGSFYSTIASFSKALQSEKFDLLLVDMGLPDGDGVTVLEWVRKNIGWDLPVICVTARDSEADVVGALRAGADDYVVKPPKYFELMARAEALTRRNKSARLPVLNLGKYEIDQENRTLSFNGAPVELTQKEYEVAAYLFQHPSKLMSRSHLLDEIWGVQADVDTRTVDTHVSRLRRKLHIYPENGWEIISVYGYGYRIEPFKPPT